MSLNRFWSSKPVGLFIVAVAMTLRLSGQSHPNYTQSELRKLMSEANEPEQRKILVSWFHGEEQTFRRKAEEENQRYERYKRSNFPSKFPAPAESARALRDYYTYRADKMAALEAKYDGSSSLAGGNPRVGVTAGAAQPGSQTERMLLERVEKLEQQIHSSKTVGQGSGPAE